MESNGTDRVTASPLKLAPKRPTMLPLLAEAILGALKGHPWTACIVLGGGIALKHYDDFRATQDVDAWWHGSPEPDALRLLQSALEPVAAAHGFDLVHRRFGVTDSFEFQRHDGAGKEFSFQIAVRDVALDDPLPSDWPPVGIETLEDNIGSKMNALVTRGAPRDFVDVYRVVNDGLLSVAECWRLWRNKNPGAPLDVARRQVLTHLTRLEARRPLGSVADEQERSSAQELREWFRKSFLVEDAS